LSLGVVAKRLDDPAPAEVMVKIIRGDAVEWTQPYLQTAMVAVDIVDVETGGFRSGATWFRQDAAGDFRLAGEADDRLAAIATELVVRRDNTAKRGNPKSGS
jgi:hypothetical protein